MEFKTKAALTEWANDQTMAEIAAYYNGLLGVKPVKKFESRDVAVTRIWAALRPEPANTVAGQPKLARKPSQMRQLTPWCLKGDLSLRDQFLFRPEPVIFLCVFRAALFLPLSVR
jgi:hypothetical protein